MPIKGFSILCREIYEYFSCDRIVLMVIVNEKKKWIKKPYNRLFFPGDFQSYGVLMKELMQGELVSNRLTECHLTAGKS